MELKESHPIVLCHGDAQVNNIIVDEKGKYTGNIYQYIIVHLAHIAICSVFSGS